MDLVHIDMHEIQHRKIGLNLLLALDALLAVDEVGIAAANMGITQSALGGRTVFGNQTFDEVHAQSKNEFPTA